MHREQTASFRLMTFRVKPEAPPDPPFVQKARELYREAPSAARVIERVIDDALAGVRALPPLSR